MDTKIWTVEDQQDAIKKAATFLKEGLTVAFPTETVYGLGADATNEEAVEKIFQAKGRPEDNPLIVHVASKTEMIKLISKLPKSAEKLVDAFTPGPITFVLPSNGACAKNVTAGLSTIAIRIPNHPVALQLLRTCNLPIAAPSANLSGKPSPTTAAHVAEDLGGKITCILDGGSSSVGMESTVIDCTEDIPFILRPGSISKEQIEGVVGRVRTVNSEHEQTEIRSPGMKYKHYSPEVPLWIVRGTSDKLQQVINDQQNISRIIVLGSEQTLKSIHAKHKVSLGNNLNEIAANLYYELRNIHADNTDLIICETFPEQGIGAAIMNRLKKASDKII